MDGYPTGSIHYCMVITRSFDSLGVSKDVTPPQGNKPLRDVTLFLKTKGARTNLEKKILKVNCKR